MNSRSSRCIWRAIPILQPHRQETFKLSGDPLFNERYHDIVGCTGSTLKSVCCAWTRRPDPNSISTSRPTSRTPRAAPHDFAAPRHLASTLARTQHHLTKRGQLMETSPPTRGNKISHRISLRTPHSELAVFYKDGCHAFVCDGSLNIYRRDQAWFARNPVPSTSAGFALVINPGQALGSALRLKHPPAHRSTDDIDLRQIKSPNIGIAQQRSQPIR